MDNLDIKILSRLLNNCRESDRQIGKELGISGGAVRARIKKMQEKKIFDLFDQKPKVFRNTELIFNNEFYEVSSFGDFIENGHVQNS